MSNERKTLIPYVAMESALEKADRQSKRLWVIIILLIVALLGSNVAWIVYENQFVTTDVEMRDIEQYADNGGDNQIIGGDYYGIGTEN